MGGVLVERVTAESAEADAAALSAVLAKTVAGGAGTTIMDKHLGSGSPDSELFADSQAARAE